jgi:hypothetical protein
MIFQIFRFKTKRPLGRFCFFIEIKEKEKEPPGSFSFTSLRHKFNDQA